MSYAILVKMPNRIIPIATENDIHQFPSEEAALDFVNNSRLCQTYEYQLVKLYFGD